MAKKSRTTPAKAGNTALLLAIFLLTPSLHSQTVPNTDFRETAVIPSFHQKNPAVVNFQTFYRKDLDQTYRLLVVRGGAPTEGWNSPHTAFELHKGDLLGLFLIDRNRPSRVWKLGIFETGNWSGLCWVDRANRSSIVIVRFSGDCWKFLFNVSSKRLLEQFRYDPVAFARFVRTGDALSAVGFIGEKPVVVAIEDRGPALVRGPAREPILARLPESLLKRHRPALPPAFPPYRLSPDRASKSCRNLPGTNRFCLLATKTGSPWILGVDERQGKKRKLHPLPQSTVEEFNAARPGNRNPVTPENIQEHFGPIQMADHFWFAKVFYDGEGVTGVGGVGFFDPDTARYVVYSPPALAPWSASALLVEQDAVWVGLVGYPEGPYYSGGLLRLDRQTRATRSYLIPDIVTAIARCHGKLFVATFNGIYSLQNGRLGRFTVEPGPGGKYRLFRGLPEQTRTGMSYPDSVLDAALTRRARSPGEAAGTVSQDLLSHGPVFVRAVLTRHWALMPKAPMKPLLVRLLDDPPPRLRDSRLRRQALRRLIELAPAEAQARLLTELRHFSPALDRQLLGLLPPASVPPMDDRLLAYLKRWQEHRAGGPSAPLLIARYLSPKARQRMHAIYASQPDPCQPEMLAYFLRADPSYAAGILKREPWEMHQPPGPCVMPFIQQVPRLQMSPLMEEFLGAYLWHEQVPVKQSAAASLSRHGSPAARKLLWNAFRYFHDYWKDRQQAMREHQDAIRLEENLRNDIARARNWIADRRELRQLGALCLGERCAAASKQDLTYWNGEPLPLAITVNSALDLHGSIAQYSYLTSLPDILDKLAQFPKGSTFRLSIAGEGAPGLRASVAAKARATAVKAGFLME